MERSNFFLILTFIIIQMITNYPITYDATNHVNKTKTFNKSDFIANDKNATISDLKYYAHKSKQNLFTQTNYFYGIFVNSINSVTDEILTLLSTITENVQDALDYFRLKITEILRKTTNLEYFLTDDMTVITKNVRFERLTVENNINVKSLAVSDYINVSRINNHSILSKRINTEDLICSTIRCRNIVSSNDVSVYLYYNNKTIPMQKSQTIRTILPDATNGVFECSVTIKQQYRVEFLDAYNKRLLQLRNDYPTSNDFRYNLLVELPEKPYKINIYCENVLLK
jgi:hypothetical protein